MAIKRLWFLSLFLILMGCQSKSVFYTLNSITVENRSQYQCVKIVASRAMQDIEYTQCLGGSCYLDEFIEGEFQYIIYVSDDPDSSGRFVEQGSIFLWRHTTCIVYADSIRWQ